MIFLFAFMYFHLLISSGRFVVERQNTGFFNWSVSQARISWLLSYRRPTSLKSSFACEPLNVTRNRRDFFTSASAGDEILQPSKLYIISFCHLQRIFFIINVQLVILATKTLRQHLPLEREAECLSLGAGTWTSGVELTWPDGEPRVRKIMHNEHLGCCNKNMARIYLVLVS